MYKPLHRNGEGRYLTPVQCMAFPPEQPVACAVSLPIFLMSEQNVFLPQALVAATPLLWLEEFLPWKAVSIVAQAEIGPLSHS